MKTKTCPKCSTKLVPYYGFNSNQLKGWDCPKCKASFGEIVPKPPTLFDINSKIVYDVWQDITYDIIPLRSLEDEN